MLGNQLKLVIRSLTRDRLYSFINIFGLAVGLACCLLLFSYVRTEHSYDGMHENADDIFRVQIETVSLEGEAEVTAGQPVPLPATMRDEFPEVEAATTFRTDPATVRSSANLVFDERVLFTDAGFFDVFSFEVLSGNAEIALNSPGQVVLTESTATKYFGRADAVGEVLEISFGDAYKAFSVAAVTKDVPSNSSIRYELLLSIQNSPDFGWLETSWTSWGSNSYIRLSDMARREAVEARFDDFVDRHYEAMVRTWRILKWISEEDESFRLSLLPLRDVHFAHSVQQIYNEVADPVYPYIMSLLAIAILALACINFTTLAVGRAMKRAREVGLRKVLGADRGQLVRQFQGEAFVFSFAALLLGIAIAESAAPIFSRAIGTTVVLDYFGSPAGVAILFGLTLTAGFFAGFYPSIYLSHLAPIDIFHRSVQAGKNRWMHALVILQFGLSAMFFFGILVISGQLRFIENLNLGFDTNQILVVPVSDSDPQESILILERFREQAANSGRIEAIAAGSAGFDRKLAWRSFSTKDGGAHLMFTNRVSTNFIDVMGMEVIAGRAFSEDYPGDVENAIVVNEALVSDFGWDNPIGERMTEEGSVVIGVIRDYNFKSLHHQIEPMALFADSRDPYSYLFVRLSAGTASSALVEVKTAWETIVPDKPFSAFFLDDDLNQKYATERQWQRMIGYATLLAVLIACLGLFGLSAFTAERRTKELGIRKVLGASAPGITLLLSRDFLKLILVGLAVFLPLAYLVMNRWLDRFAYRFEPGAFEFILAALAVVLIAATTVSYQAIRSAVADPIDSLRYE